MRATTRSALLAGGLTRSAIDARVRRGELIVVHPGVYAADDSPASMLHAHLLRAGAAGVVSHRAAARLHAAEGFLDCAAVDISVGAASTFRSRPAIRSVLTPDDITEIDGMRVTTLARTIVDLARFASTDELEVALESMLRGTDPTRPDRWRTEVLHDIEERLVGNHARGTTRLREVLGRRPEGCRPTGSYAETVMLQALRRLGHGDVLRQPTLILSDPELGSGQWYPDFFDPLAGVADEVDGIAGHAPVDRRRRDGRRDNVLGNVVRVLRHVAGDVLADADQAAGTFAAVVARRRRAPWLDDRYRMTVSGQVVRIRRVA